MKSQKMKSIVPPSSRISPHIVSTWSRYSVAERYKSKLFATEQFIAGHFVDNMISDHAFQNVFTKYAC